MQLQDSAEMADVESAGSYQVRLFSFFLSYISFKPLVFLKLFTIKILLDSPHGWFKFDLNLLRVEVYTKIIN